MTRLEIPAAWLDEAFTAVQTIQTKVLPVAHDVALLAEIVDPADAMLIAGLDAGIGKLFELLVKLRQGAVVDVTDATLRASTLEAWRKEIASPLK